MSIIHDALKKTNQPIVTQTKKEPFRPELLKGKSRIHWGPLLVVAILILITAPILAPVFHEVSPTAPAPTQTKAPNMKAQFAIEEAPIAPVLQRPAAASANPVQFALTGLIYSTGGSYCLINGRVVKVGESVGDAKLVDVTPNEAILEYRGERIVLPANV